MNSFRLILTVESDLDEETIHRDLVEQLCVAVGQWVNFDLAKPIALRVIHARTEPLVLAEEAEAIKEMVEQL